MHNNFIDAVSIIVILLLAQVISGGFFALITWIKDWLYNRRKK